MFAKITISNENAKKLYEANESLRQDAWYKLYKSLTPGSLVYERPEKSEDSDTFTLVIDVDTINALYRRPDYEKAMKKMISNLFMKEAEGRFGTPKTESAKTSTPVAPTTPSVSVKKDDGTAIKDILEGGEAIVYVIPDIRASTHEIVFGTVTKPFFEREHCCCDEGFVPELLREYKIPEKEIIEMVGKLDKLGFEEEEENVWILDEKRGDKLVSALGKNLDKLFDAINRSKKFPVTFEILELEKFEKVCGSYHDDEDSDSDLYWEKEGKDIEETKDSIFDDIDALPMDEENIEYLKRLKALIEKKLKEEGV